MTTAKDDFWWLATMHYPYLQENFIGNGRDAENLVDNQGGNYHGNGSKKQHVRFVHFEHSEQEY